MARGFHLNIIFSPGERAVLIFGYIPEYLFTQLSLIMIGIIFKGNIFIFNFLSLLFLFDGLLSLKLTVSRGHNAAVAGIKMPQCSRFGANEAGGIYYLLTGCKVSMSFGVVGSLQGEYFGFCKPYSTSFYKQDATLYCHGAASYTNVSSIQCVLELAVLL